MKNLNIILICLLFWGCCNQNCDDKILPVPICPDSNSKPNGSQEHNYVRIVEILPNPSDSIEIIKIKNYKLESVDISDYFIQNKRGEDTKLSDYISLYNDLIEGCEITTFEIKNKNIFDDKLDTIKLKYINDESQFPLVQSIFYINSQEDEWFEFYTETGEIQ